MAFADLQDDMDCAESYLKYCLKYVLDTCAEDMKFFNNLSNSHHCRKGRKSTTRRHERLAA